MAKLLNKLKNLFVVEEEVKEALTGSGKKKDKKTKEVPKQTIEPKTQPVKGKVNKKFTEVLLTAVEKNNLEGFDYLEYKEALQNLSKMSMDEPTRYKSAFALAQTMNTTPDSLVETAQYYVDILSKEETKFKEALVKQRKKQIGGREEEIDSYEKGIVAKQQQIERLNQEITEMKKTLQARKSEISSAVQKLETTKENFFASYKSLVQQIQSDIEKMQRYLK